LFLQAVKYYQEAIAENNTNAFVSLALMYYNGIGVSKNYIKSFEYFTIAASRGHSLAKYFTGQCLELGHGTVRNLGESIKMYELVTNSGPAAKRLEELYKQIK